MILEKTNIEDKLRRARKKQKEKGLCLEEVQAFLESDVMRDAKISAELGSASDANFNAFSFDALETDRIFHIEQIKQICIDYRLRFLDSHYFKGEIPNGALTEIKRLEQAHNTTLKGFKIMAPSRLFKLEDKDDPLLFAPIGNGYHYLVHKWGNDLHPLRKMMVWPFKNMVNLTLFVVLISYVATFLVPNGLFSKNNSTAEFWIIFFFMFKAIASVVIFYGFALGKNFNPAIWNSKYFNA
ncbi:hypothetical protein [Flagellimonas meishanensis]|uniref:hypothetical protein n=1 Tax=Flagellimonas meishanensis TaxID=2873264 RepID=UPI001CA79318|nr:hypothetical protein [[Muricauda] meishanensis]